MKVFNFFILLLIILSTVLVFTLPAPAVEFSDIQFQNRPFLEVSGEILPGDGELIISKLETNQYEGLSFHSNGGDSPSVLVLGPYLLDHNFDTYIGPTKECFSACGILFLMGKHRYLDKTGVIGLHSASETLLDNNGDVVTTLIDPRTNMFFAYLLGRQGYDIRVNNIFLFVSPFQIYILDQEDSEVFNLGIQYTVNGS